MKTLNRFAGAAVLVFGMTTALVMAEDHDSKRYYDKEHNDYHAWNDNETKSYGVFLNEKHIQVHVFSKAKPSEQQQYWKWRHEHPDEKR